MKTSAHGLELLAEWEGARAKVYNDSAGLPTIGVGHLLRPSENASGKINIAGKAVPFRPGLTHDQVHDLLAQDVARFEEAINENVKVPLKQNQFDALVAFAFNVGVDAFLKSTLLHNLALSDLKSVPTQLRRWTKVDGKVVPGLVNRRENEINLWLGKAENVRTE